MKSLVSLATLIAAIFAVPAASAISYDVYAAGNSSSGSGTPLDTISLTVGEWFSVAAAVDDLWSAGALPRWSNADGLIGLLLATGSDESGQPVNTQIGIDFGMWNQNSFSAPYGALVGQIGSSYILFGTSWSGTAPESGVLRLMYWDSNSFDNSEKISVEITTRSSNVPDQGGIALGAISFLALFLARCATRRRA